MKKLTPEEIIRIETLRLKRERKRLERGLSTLERVRSQRKKIRASHKSLSDNIFAFPGQLSIELPSVVSFKDNYEQTINFINALRDAVLTDRMPVFLHFDNVISVSPAAALVMTAEIYRCRNLRPGRGKKYLVNGNWPSNDSARQLLSRMGFYRLMGLPDNLESAGESKADKSIHLGFTSLKNVDAGKIAEFHQELLSKININLGSQEAKRLQGAIIEAIGNANEHAYKGETRYQILKNRAWMSGYIDTDKSELMFMVMDQGTGIPNTLDPTFIERALAVGSLSGTTPSDAELIRLATTLNRTSTHKSGRGKGFETMKRFVQTVDDAELRILSNRGEYLFKSDSDESNIDRIGSLGGTLVQWSVSAW